MSIPTLVYNLLRNILENGFKRQRQIIQDRLLTGERGSIRILDVGCGTGTYADLFDPDRYVGLEVESAYINYARQTKKLNFIQADARYMPFKDDMFGIVCIIAIFHHLPVSWVMDVMKEIERVTYAGGVILIMDQAKIKLGFMENWLFALIRRFDKGKFIRTPEENMNIILGQPGISVVDAWKFRSGLITYQSIILKKR